MKRLHLYRNLKMKDVDFYCMREDSDWFYGFWVTRLSVQPLSQDRIAKVRFFEEDWSEVNAEIIDQLIEDNKRYREALEEILKIDSFTHFGANSTPLIITVVREALEIAE